MPYLKKLDDWMCDEELSLQDLADVLDMSPQCLHKGLARGTFARVNVAKLVKMSPLTWEDFVLPEERKAVRSSLTRWAKSWAKRREAA